MRAATRFVDEKLRASDTLEVSTVLGAIAPIDPAMHLGAPAHLLARATAGRGQELKGFGAL